jgi:hypothetical protein
MHTLFYIMLGFVYVGIVICGCIDYHETYSNIKLCEIILHNIVVCIYIGCGVKSWYHDKEQYDKDNLQTNSINCLMDFI